MDELLFLNGLLLSRRVFIFNDGRLSGRAITLLASVQAALCLLLFTPGWPVVILAVLVLLVHMATGYWSNENWLNESRILSLLVILVATTALRDQLTLAPWLQAVLTELMSIYGGAVANIDDFLSPALWFLLGFLLVANETNLLIRSLFHRFNLEPRVRTDPARLASHWMPGLFPEKTAQVHGSIHHFQCQTRHNSVYQDFTHRCLIA